jgi:hypothetical protein
VAPTATVTPLPATPTPAATATDMPTPVPPTPTGTATPLPDADGDGAPDAIDNCSFVANPGQENTSAAIDNGPDLLGDDTTVPMSHMAGDACSIDADEDGLPNALETSPFACGAFDLSTTTHPNPASGDITNDDNGNGNPAVPEGTDPADDGPLVGHRQ